MSHSSLAGTGRTTYQSPDVYGTINPDVVVYSKNVLCHFIEREAVMSKKNHTNKEYPDVTKAAAVYEQLKLTIPTNQKHLYNFVKFFLGINIPRRRICSEHNAPIEYLWHSLSMDRKVE